MKERSLPIAFLVAASLFAAGQTPDVVQAPFGEPILRKPVPACQNHKHVNVFIRFDNRPTIRADETGNLMPNKFIYPTLVKRYLEGLENLIKDQGFCVYFSPIYASTSTFERITSKTGFISAQLDPSLALSPTETSTELEKEPPYVLVSILATVEEEGERVFITMKNRWLGFTPEIIPVTLQPPHIYSVEPETIAADIEWLANRIPAVKSKVFFEGRELSSAPGCQEPSKPAEVQATDLNWRKSADAACRVSSVYFDRNGNLKKCADMKTEKD